MTTAQEILTATFNACDYMYDYITYVTDGETVIGMASIESKGHDISDELLDEVARELRHCEHTLTAFDKLGYDTSHHRMIFAMVGATIDNTRRHLHTPLGMGWSH